MCWENFILVKLFKIFWIKYNIKLKWTILGEIVYSNTNSSYMWWPTGNKARKIQVSKPENIGPLKTPNLEHTRTTNRRPEGWRSRNTDRCLLTGPNYLLSRYSRKCYSINEGCKCAEYISPTVPFYVSMTYSNPFF